MRKEADFKKLTKMESNFTGLTKPLAVEDRKFVREGLLMKGMFVFVVFCFFFCLKERKKRMKERKK